MIRAICQCKEVIYLDPETGHKFQHNSTDYPHKCQSRPIALYDGNYLRREEYIARDITDEQIRLGMDLNKPYKRTYKGDFLFIS